MDLNAVEKPSISGEAGVHLLRGPRTFWALEYSEIIFRYANAKYQILNSNLLYECCEE